MDVVGVIESSQEVIRSAFYFIDLGFFSLLLLRKTRMRYKWRYSTQYEIQQY